MRETINSLTRFYDIVKYNNSSAIHVDLNGYSIDFDLIFNNPIETVNLRFKDCVFNNPIHLSQKLYGQFEFHNCIFKNTLNISEITFKYNVRFFNCIFNEFLTTNTTFENLADFWRSTFNKPLIFLKTDFKGITVFSAVNFRENVLFTYTLFDDSVFFRGTKFEKGVDLSLAVSTGTLGLFDIRLKQFESLNNLIDSDEDGYENAVTETAQIPLKNKLETFRILKKRFEDLGDIPSSIEFKVLEKESLREKINSKHHKNQNWWTTCFDRLSLTLNKCSNNFGKSINRALLFTISVGLFFFTFSLLALEEFTININYSFISYEYYFSYFIKFMNPTHNIDYLDIKVINNGWFYLFDYLGRAFVGYGTYQFIQAFRKFK